MQGSSGMQIAGTDQTGLGLAGSTYLRGIGNNQFDQSKDDENWDQESEASEPDDLQNCEERGEFIFENRARYKGQWRDQVRHGYGTQIWPDGAKYEGNWKNNKAHG